MTHKNFIQKISKMHGLTSEMKEELLSISPRLSENERKIALQKLEDVNNAIDTNNASLLQSYAKAKEISDSYTHSLLPMYRKASEAADSRNDAANAENLFS